MFVKKVTVVGAGYVGLSMATLLARHHDVCVVDLDVAKVECINRGGSPIDDKKVAEKLAAADSGIRAFTVLDESIPGSDFVVIATPTDYNPETGYFDVTSVMAVCNSVFTMAPKTQIVIKSTIPIGCVDKIRKELPGVNVFFCPEFLREGRALLDNLMPSRIVVGSFSEQAQVFAKMLVDASENPECPIISMESREAEAVKLFANGYLAMRVAFFNELDNFAMASDLDAESVVKAVSLDSRIGDFYNNPSFGYGGYCFPKDTKQLLADFDGIDNALIAAIVESNEIRKSTIADCIASQVTGIVGIYKLAMKAGSDNYRSAAIIDVIKKLKAKSVDVVIFDSAVEGKELFGCEVVKCFDSFVNTCDLVVANRSDSKLTEAGCKVFTRDLFGGDL